MKKNLFLIISAMFFIVQNAYAQTNSYNMLAKPLTDLISMKYSDQTEEVVKAVKKEKDRLRVQEELQAKCLPIEQLSALDETRLSELNTFLSSMSTPALRPEEINETDLTVFLPPVEDLKEVFLYLFIDGSCYGAGSFRKGLLVQIPLTVVEDGLHEMVILASSSNAPYPLSPLFSSTVHFGIKSAFFFEVQKKGRGFELLLQN